MNRSQIYHISSGRAQTKVKSFLAECGYSRREISRLSQSAGILRNGKPCRLTELLEEGDELTVTAPFRDEANTQLRSHKPEILYEDEYLVIVNKPRGMTSHSSAEHKTDDLGTLMKSYYGDPFTVRTIGRLDRDVCGVMIFAKDRETARRMSAKKEAGEIRKEYIGIAEGTFDRPQGSWIYDVEKVPGKAFRTVSEKGTACETSYTVLKQYKEYALMKIRIKAGKTHQIRAGFAHFGHPLAGDRLYGSRSIFADRVQLAAVYTSFQHPYSGETVRVELPIPEDSRAILDNLK